MKIDEYTCVCVRNLPCSLVHGTTQGSIELDSCRLATRVSYRAEQVMVVN